MAFHLLLELLANITEGLSMECSTSLPSVAVWLWDVGVDYYVHIYLRWHLQTMAGYRWLNRVISEALYKLTRTQPISVRLINYMLQLAEDKTFRSLPMLANYITYTGCLGPLGRTRCRSQVAKGRPKQCHTTARCAEGRTQPVEQSCTGRATYHCLG